jgi:hypothetical protein
MEAVNWQSYVAMDDRGAGAADLHAALVAADDADCEEHFDLGEPWDAEFDPTDDDPE